jgi:NNP family nitrate/nitrite transporter-like MFS transporter
MAAGLYLPSAIASLTAIIPSRHWGKALAIHDIAPNLSFVAAPLVCEAALVWFSWRTVFLLTGFGALVMSPVFTGYSRGGQFRGKAPSFVSLRQLFGNWSVWVLVLLFSLGIISTMGIYTMLPLYLVSEYGMDASLANKLIALSRIPSIVIVFFGGWANDRIGPWRMIKIVLLFTGLMTFLLGIASRSLISYIIFLQPLVAACFFPCWICGNVSNGPRSIKEYCCFTHYSADHRCRRRPGARIYWVHQRYGQLWIGIHNLRRTDYCWIVIYRCV